MPHPLRRALPALLLAVLGACAAAPRAATSPVPASSFAGVGGVDVLVFTDLPDTYAAPRGLRSLAVRERVRARLAAAGVPLLPDSAAFDHTRPSMRLALSALRVGTDEFAVWSRVSLDETVRLRRRPELPLMISTWIRDGKLVVRGDDVAPLWREVDRLTDEFVREFREANGNPGASSG